MLGRPTTDTTYPVACNGHPHERVGGNGGGYLMCHCVREPLKNHVQNRSFNDHPFLQMMCSEPIKHRRGHDRWGVSEQLRVGSKSESNRSEYRTKKRRDKNKKLLAHDKDTPTIRCSCDQPPPWFMLRCKRRKHLLQIDRYFSRTAPAACIQIYVHSSGGMSIVGAVVHRYHPPHGRLRQHRPPPKA